MSKTGSTGGQERKKRSSGGEGDGDAGQVTTETAKKAAEVTEELDELLDEIDSVLEENAEEFVRSFIQKGGQ